MRIRTKFLLPLALVFLIASAPFCSAAVSVKVGDKVELPYKMTVREGGTTETQEGTIVHLVTAVIEEPGVITYDAKHKITYPNGTAETYEVTNEINTTKSPGEGTTEGEIDAMTDDDKLLLTLGLLLIAGHIIGTGAGLIVAEGGAFAFDYNYKVDGSTVTVSVDAKWGDDGRLKYYFFSFLYPEGEVNFEIGEKSIFDSLLDSIPGFPVEALLGFCALSVFMVMRKNRKEE
jgi:hypothetical protein